MRDLLKCVEQTIATRRLARRGQPLLVAVSGGADSMVLLHVLRALSGAHAWRLTVAHFNHRLRGRSSDADERLVLQTADRLGLPVMTGQADVKAAATAQKISVELAARRLRHDFLARSAIALRIRSIALAHHADDQVELFFIRLLRGCGNEGLAGMKWQNPSPANPAVRLIRPLLDRPKAELLDYARTSRIHFREDASNALPSYRRNHIRHHLLPWLRRQYQPALDRVIGRVMEVAAAEADFVNAAALEWLDAADAPPFGKLHCAVQRRCVQLQLHASAVAADYDLVERLRTGTGERIVIGPGRTVWLDSHGRLQCETAAAVQPSQVDLPGFHPTAQGVALDLVPEGGSIEFGGASVEWRFAPKRVASLRKRGVPGCELFDAGKVGRRITLRHWRSGDRFQPSGMPRAVKLQDLFTNLKIPRLDRHGLVIASTAGGDVFWVERLRISERFKVTAETTCGLLWRWKRP